MLLSVCGESPSFPRVDKHHTSQALIGRKFAEQSFGIPPMTFGLDRYCELQVPLLDENKLSTQKVIREVCITLGVTSTD